MCKYVHKFAFFPLLIGSFWFDPVVLAQQTKGAAGSGSGVSSEKAISLGEQGQCRESIAALKRAMTSQVPAETKKKAGVVGMRCSVARADRAPRLTLIGLLNKQLPRDAHR